MDQENVQNILKWEQVKRGDDGGRYFGNIS